MDSPEVMRAITDEDPTHQQIASLVIELERHAYAVLADADPLHATSVILTAGAVLSGSMFGRLLMTGAADQKDKRRAAEAAARNFRTGIDIGKRAATRVLSTNVAGHA
jgi:hypothetical protein